MQPLPQCCAHVSPLSVIAFVSPHLATEHVIGPRRVHEDDRNDEERPYERKPLALRWTCRFPYVYIGRYDVGPDADAQTAVAQKHEAQRQNEWCRIRLAIQRAQQHP